MDNSNNDDPKRLLFTCRHCGYWPMACQKMAAWSSDVTFGCPRCKSHAIFHARQTEPALQTREPTRSA